MQMSSRSQLCYRSINLTIEVSVTKQEEEPKETTDILEALKASLKVNGKPTLAKAKGKMGMAAVSK